MPIRPAGLSKSKLLSYRQCPKRLYLEVHGASLGLESSAGALDPMLAKHGDDIGRIARSLYGPGEMIGEPGASLADCLDQTREVLAGKTATLFEATLDHEGVLVRADVLKRSRGRVELIEVKSSTIKGYERNAVKQDILHFDCAVQRWTLEKSGIAPRKVKLAMVDSAFVYGGDGSYDGLLREIDVTSKVSEMATSVVSSVRHARSTLAGELPVIPPGKHCTVPYVCPFQDFCAGGEERSEYPAQRLLTLRNRRNKEVMEEVERNGWTDLREVPRKILSDDRDLRIWDAVKTGKPQLRREARTWASGLPYPRYYIDFETIQFAVPIWAQTRPYEQLPFQWSCHTERADGSLEHKAFLAEGKGAPMRAFAESLIKAVGKSKAPVMVYSAAMEVSRLKDLAIRFPDLRLALQAIITRIVDILPVMRDHYYHRDMDGSWSIKAVLPTIAPELTYHTLGAVQDGSAAQWAYLRLLDDATPVVELQRIRKDLLAYCQHDTLAMVKLVQYLQGCPL